MSQQFSEQRDALGASIDTEVNEGVGDSKVSVSPMVALHEAIERDEIETARSLLTLNPGLLSETDEEWYTILHLAAELGKLDFVKMFLENGAAVEAQNKKNTLVLIAARQGHVPVLECLAQFGADLNTRDVRGWTPAHIAARQGHVPVLERLAQFGADLNVPDKTGCTPAHIAAYQGHVSVLDFFATLEDVDFNKANEVGSTPVWIAAQNGHVGVLEFLAKKTGVDFNKANNERSTPVWIAAQNGHVGVLEFLAKHGADFNLLDDFGWSPLCVAILREKFDVVEFLLDFKVNVRTTKSPLLMLCERNFDYMGVDEMKPRLLMMIKKLLELGCDLNVLDVHHINFSSHMTKELMLELISLHLPKYCDHIPLSITNKLFYEYNVSLFELVIMNKIMNALYEIHHNKYITHNQNIAICNLDFLLQDPNIDINIKQHFGKSIKHFESSVKQVFYNLFPEPHVMPCYLKSSVEKEYMKDCLSKKESIQERNDLSLQWIVIKELARLIKKGELSCNDFLALQEKAKNRVLEKAEAIMKAQEEATTTGAADFAAVASPKIVEVTEEEAEAIIKAQEEATTTGAADFAAVSFPCSTQTTEASVEGAYGILGNMQSDQEQI